MMWTKVQHNNLAIVLCKEFQLFTAKLAACAVRCTYWGEDPSLTEVHKIWLRANLPLSIKHVSLLAPSSDCHDQYMSSLHVLYSCLQKWIHSVCTRLILLPLWFPGMQSMVKPSWDNIDPDASVMSKTLLRTDTLDGKHFWSAHEVTVSLDYCHLCLRHLWGKDSM